MPNIGLPVTMSGLSTPGTRVPTIVKSLGSLSGTLAMSGGVIAAALSASSPYVARRPLARCVTAPDAVLSSAAGTPHIAAAAATSMWRAAAPVRRMLS